MALRFSIIDQFGNATQIDEPVGWDGINLHYIRHKDWHGFIDTVDDTMGSLQFYGSGYKILKAAFTSYCLEAQCGFLVEFQCADGGDPWDGTSWDTIYRGQFSFHQYKEIQGLNGCHVECSVESNNNVMTLKNRYEHKVNLDSRYPFQTPVSPEASVHAQILAMSTTRTSPPILGIDPLNNGDTYLIPSGSSGWGGTSGQIAVRTDSGWNYTSPASGQVLIDMSTRIAYEYAIGPGWTVYTDTFLPYPSPDNSYLGGITIPPTGTSLLGGNIMLPSKSIIVSTSATVSPIIPADPSTSTSPCNDYYYENNDQSAYCFTLGFNVGTEDVPTFSGINDTWTGNLFSTTGDGTVGQGSSPLLTYTPNSNYYSPQMTFDITINFSIVPDATLTTPLQISSFDAVLCQGPGAFQDAYRHNRIMLTSILGSTSTSTTISATYSITGVTATVPKNNNIYLVFQFCFNGRVDHNGNAPHMGATI